MNKDNFVKRRKFDKPLAKGTGGCNPCFRPPSEASKADLVEMHREDMRIKRSKRGKPSLFLAGANCSPALNRHTGKPHEHKREIARHARQAAA